jgi:CRISPR-associated endonuclease Cas1
MFGAPAKEGGGQECADMSAFANNWTGLTSKPESDTEIPGNLAYDCVCRELKKTLPDGASEDESRKAAAIIEETLLRYSEKAEKRNKADCENKHLEKLEDLKKAVAEAEGLPDADIKKAAKLKKAKTALARHEDQKEKEEFEKDFFANRREGLENAVVSALSKPFAADKASDVGLSEDEFAATKNHISKIVIASEMKAKDLIRLHYKGGNPGLFEKAMFRYWVLRKDADKLVNQAALADFRKFIKDDKPDVEPKLDDEHIAEMPLIVSVKGEAVRKLPGQQVRAIYCYGAVQITAQAAETCLELGIDVSYFSPAGRFIGLLRGLPASGVDARRGQYRLFELPGVRLQLAREAIRAKIHNQRVMLMRNGDAPDRVLSLMSGFRDATESARDLTALLGIEGGAAALYFEQFESMLKQRDDWKFDWRGRNRRPPRDPVNALLSLGYSMLAKELTGVCHSVGLDPFLGFMHQPRYGRPALALDLMEEFRPLVADSVAISLINRGELGPEDFIRSANGTFLNDRGRRPFWEAWFRRLDAEVSHPEFSYKMAYRRMLEVQARQLWRFVRGEALTYHGFTTR